jgi:hypothetical protein
VGTKGRLVKEFSDWLERQAELERRSPSLENAFVRDRFWPYAFHRLRFFLARSVLNWAVHAAGVMLLFGVFSRSAFGAIALAHFLSAFASSFWWGSLEEMRGHIRRLYRSGRPDLIPREVGRWLALSLRLAVGVLLAGAVWVGAHAVWARTSPGLVEVYLLCIALRLALEIPCRCYHSGLYAIRRIYRPLPAMLAVDVFGFVGLVALWPVLGSWSFPVASLLSSVVVTGVAVHYTARAYRLLGFQPFRHLAGRRGRRFTTGSMAELAAAGLASGVMSLDAVLALVVLMAGAERGRFAALFILFFAISPAIRAGYEWAQLFYFDLKRLETAPFRNLSAWLGSRVLRLGWVVGLVFWAAACLAAVGVVGKPAWSLCLPLLPFFHSRSLLAALQVRNFTEGAYGRLIANGLLLLAGYMAVAVFLDGGDALLGLAAINYCAVLLLWGQAAGRWRLGRWKEALPPAVWFHSVSRVQTPIRISAMRYCPNDGEHSWRRKRDAVQGKAQRLARQIARKLGPHGAVTVMHPGRILWFDRAQDRTVPLVHWAIARGAGLLELVGQTGPHPDGGLALREARARGFFGDDVRQCLPGKSGPIADRARSAFRQLFPDGMVWAPGGPVDRLAHLSPRETRNLLIDASVFVRDLYPNGRRSGLEVTALCEGNDLQSVFVVNRSSNPTVRTRWRSVIRCLNLDAAMLVKENGLPHARAAR